MTIFQKYPMIFFFLAKKYSKVFIKGVLKMQNQKVPKFQIQLDPEYEEEIFSRFIELADEAIKQSVERASISKQFLTQKEVMEELRIGHVVMNDLYENGLQFIKIGNKKLIDIDDLKETLNKLKF